MSVLLRIVILLLFLSIVIGVAGDLVNGLALPPDLFTGSPEFWRLLTWPLAPGFGTLLIASVAFFTPAEEVEGLVGHRAFGLGLLFVTLVSGLLHLLFFSGTAPLLTGLIPAAFAVMAAYLYFFPEAELKVFFARLRARSLAIIMGILWLLLIGLSLSGPYDAFLLLSSGGVAALLALLWVHGRYQRYDVMPGATWVLSHLTGEHEGGESTALPSGRPTRFGRPIRPRRGKSASASRSEQHKRERTELSPAQRADALLDKIASRGIGALTREEREFLEEYSRKM